MLVSLRLSPPSLSFSLSLCLAPCRQISTHQRCSTIMHSIPPSLPPSLPPVPLSSASHLISTTGDPHHLHHARDRARARRARRCSEAEAARSCRDGEGEGARSRSRAKRIEAVDAEEAEAPPLRASPAPRHRRSGPGPELHIHRVKPGPDRAGPAKEAEECFSTLLIPIHPPTPHPTPQSPPAHCLDL